MVEETTLFPTLIQLKQRERLLNIHFEDGSQFSLPCEYLRVFSPSAEVQGHGQQEPELVLGKSEVNISNIDPVGHYAVKLIFDDGHHSGLYSWDFLYELGSNYQNNWQRYLQRCLEIESRACPHDK